MMPEPLPLDRKGFFKERRHERGQSFDAVAAAGTGGGSSTPCSGVGSSTPRWREPYRPYRRPPPSYYQIYEDSPYERRYGGTSGGGGRGVSRESRGGPFRRSPFRGSTPHVTSQRSVAVPIYSPPPLKDLVNDKNGGNDQRSHRDPHRDRDRDSLLRPITWKPLMWSRQGSFNLLARSETEVPAPNLGKESPVASLADLPAQADDGLPRKKPRLGWGQGLAKYEKQKVEGAVNSGKDRVSETSTKFTGVAGSTSPVTPCSTGCSSPGMDGTFSKATSVENGTIHLSHPPPLGSKSCSEELSINTDHLPPRSTLNSLLNDLLQTEDACFGDSTFTTSVALDKLLLFKADIAKELETTEYEIDLFDNELQSLKAGQERVQRQSSYITQNDSDPISCLVSPEGSLKMSLNFTPGLSSTTRGTTEPVLESPEGSLKMSLNFTPGLSSTIRGTTEPVLESSSSHKPDVQFKNADDSILQLLKSKIVESESLGQEMPCIFTMDSTGYAANVDDTFEVQHSIANDAVDRITNENDLRDVHTFDASTSGASYTGGGSSHGRDSNDLIASIMASNKDAAKLASQVFDKSLPTIVHRFDPWESGQILSCRKNDLQVKEKLALQKHQLKIKERLLTLKFRALHCLWKEDLRLLFVKKRGLKSHKRFKLHNQSSQSGSQQHRSSFQSGYTLPAGNMIIVPTADIVNYTGKLLDSHIKMFRSNLKMPALILDEKERNCSRFITKNGLLEDPQSFEKERTMINPWTEEERRIFMEMLATFGKDFGKISSCLSHKTTADCIEFYYKNHKSDSFRDVKKQLDSRKQRQCLTTSTYMVTAGKQRNQEANATSLDMLGAASLITAHKKVNTRNQQKYARRTDLPSYHSPKLSRASHGFLERAKGGEISALDKETTAAGVLAGICGALSSEAVSSCVTSSVNCVMSDRPLTPGLTQFIEEDDTCSDEGRGELLYSVDWTDEEKSEFIRALRVHGKYFANISHHVGTKSRDQCRIFFSKARKCLGLDMIQPAAGSVGTPVSDASGGRSDMNDACATELGSAICSTQSCSKMDGYAHAGNSSSKTETGRSSEQYALRGSNKDVHDPKSALKVEKLKTGDTNLQVSSTPEEVDDNSLSCNSEEFSEDAKSIRVVKVHVRPPVEQITTCTKNEQWKPNATVRRSSPADVMKNAAVLKNDTEQRNNSVNLPAAEESDSNITGIASHVVSNTNDSQQLKPLESVSCLQKKPRLTSLHDPSAIYPEASIRVNSPSTINFEDHRSKIRKVSAARDSSRQHLLGNQLVNQIDHTSCPKETAKDAKTSEKSVMLGIDRCFVPVTNNEKCSGSPVSSSRSVTFPAPCENQSNYQVRSCLRNGCEEGEEQSTHVKLFGRILGSPSPSQKSSSSSEKEFASAQVPGRSFGFWGGNEIQTGFSSLHESDSVYQSSDGVSNAVNVSSVNRKQLPEVASGFQRQGRKAMARLGVNTVGGAGVSDPVAALLAATGRALPLDGETEQLRTDLGGR